MDLPRALADTEAGSGERGLDRAIVAMSKGPHIALRMLGDGALDRASCGMDASVWSQLPKEMLTCALLRLPRMSQMRFQAVCKEWRSYLSSPACLQQSRSGALLCGFRLEAGGSDLEERKPKRKGERRLEVVRAIPQFCHSLGQALDRRPDAARVQVMAQDGALCVLERTEVCLEGPSRREFRHLFFINPITGTWRRLINSGGLQSDCVELGRAKADISNDQLFYACSTNQSWFQGWISGAYSHRTRSWTQPRSSYGPVHPGDWRRRCVRHLPRSLKACAAAEWSDPVHDGAVICNGQLYSYEARDHRMCLVVRNIETGTCESFPLEIPGASRHPRFFLVKARGTVFFVGLSRHGARFGYHICRLEQVPLKWTHLAAMPEALLDQLAQCGLVCGDEERNLEMFDACIGADAFVFLVLRSRAALKIVSFDPVNQCWRFCFQNEDLASFDGFFQPRMDLQLYRPGCKGKDGVFTWEDSAGYLNCDLL